LANQLNLRINPNGAVFLFPNIGSYFGGDLIAGILFSDLDKKEYPCLMVDVGTNAEKFIPEFSKIINKIQYNHYHLFPVDKHSIRCVQIINSFKHSDESDINNLYHSVFKEVRSKTLLLLTALLHDIGKSDPAKEHSKTGARIAKSIFKRFGFNTSQVEDAVFLIQNHLLLVKTATRRDISDEETAIYMANKVEKNTRMRE